MSSYFNDDDGDDGTSAGLSTDALLSGGGGGSGGGRGIDLDLDDMDGGDRGGDRGLMAGDLEGNVDAQTEDELLFAVQSLGRRDKEHESIFRPGNLALDGLKAINFLLKRDHPERQTVHYKLGELQHMKHTFIPLLISARDDHAILKLLTRTIAKLLTPLKPDVHNAVARERQLQSYKLWFVESEAIATLMAWIAGPLTEHPSGRTTDSRDAIDLTITIFRNLLLIPDPIDTPETTALSTHLQDRLILRLAQDNALETFSYMCHFVHDGQDRSTNMLCLELFAALFRMETGEDVFATDRSLGLIPPETVTDAHKHKQAMKQAGESVAAKLGASLLDIKQQRVHTSTSRHSRFGTEWVVQKKLLGGRTQFVTNVFAPAEYLSSDAKSSRVQAKKIVAQTPHRMYLNGHVQESLILCVDILLSHGYVDLMTFAKGDIEGAMVGRDFLAEDTANFMSLCAFIMSFQRIRSKQTLIAARKKFNELQTARTDRITKRRAADRAAGRTGGGGTPSAKLPSLSLLLSSPSASSANKSSSSEPAGPRGPTEQTYEGLFGPDAPPSPVMSGSGSGAGRVGGSDEFGPDIYDESTAATIDLTISARLTQELTQTSVPATQPLASGPGSPAVLASSSQLPKSPLKATPMPTSVSSSNSSGDKDEKKLPMSPISAAASAADKPSVPTPLRAAPGEYDEPELEHDPDMYFDPGPVYQTLTVETYHFISKRIEELVEQKPVQWQYVMPAVDMYTQYIRCVYEMVHFGSQSTQSDGDILQRNAFYDQKELELMVTLLKQYDTARLNRRHLNNLVISAYFSMQLMSGLENTNHVVLGKRRKVSQRKPKAAKPVDAEAAPEGDKDADGKNKGDSEKTPEKADGEQKGMDTDKPKEIAASTGAAAATDGKNSEAAPSVPPVTTTVAAVDDGKAAAIDTSAPMADDAAPNKSAQNSDDKAADSKADNKESESKAMDAIDVAAAAADDKKAEGGDAESAKKKKSKDKNRDKKDKKKGPVIVKSTDDPDVNDPAAASASGSVELDENGEPKEKAVYSRKESDFEFSKFVLTYAHPVVLKNYMLLYDTCKTNTEETNTAVLDLFNRLAFEHKLPAMFWHLPFFMSFDKLLNDPTAKNQPSVDLLRRFTKKIVRGFFDLTATNPVLWIELLFWRTAAASASLSTPDSVKRRAMETFDMELDDDMPTELRRNLAAAFQDANMDDLYGDGITAPANAGKAQSVANSAAHPMQPVALTEEQKAAKRKQVREATAALISALNKKRSEKEQQKKDEQDKAKYDALVAAGKRWSIEMDATLIAGFDQHKENPDMIDILTAHIPNRTRQQVMARLRALGLKRPKIPGARRRRKARADDDGVPDGSNAFAPGRARDPLAPAAAPESESDGSEEDADEAEASLTGRPYFKRIKPEVRDCVKLLLDNGCDPVLQWLSTKLELAATAQEFEIESKAESRRERLKKAVADAKVAGAAIADGNATPAASADASSAPSVPAASQSTQIEDDDAGADISLDYPEVTRPAPAPPTAVAAATSTDGTSAPSATDSGATASLPDAASSASLSASGPAFVPPPPPVDENSVVGLIERHELTNTFFRVLGLVEPVDTTNATEHSVAPKPLAVWKIPRSFTPSDMTRLAKLIDSSRARVTNPATASSASSTASDAAKAAALKAARAQKALEVVSAFQARKRARDAYREEDDEGYDSEEVARAIALSRRQEKAKESRRAAIGERRAARRSKRSRGDDDTDVSTAKKSTAASASASAPAKKNPDAFIAPDGEPSEEESAGDESTDSEFSEDEAREARDTRKAAKKAKAKAKAGSKASGATAKAPRKSKKKGDDDGSELDIENMKYDFELDPSKAVEALEKKKQKRIKHKESKSKSKTNADAAPTSSATAAGDADAPADSLPATVPDTIPLPSASASALPSAPSSATATVELSQSQSQSQSAEFLLSQSAVSDSKLSERLNAIVATANLDLLTARQLRKQLETEFGANLKVRSAFINAALQRAVEARLNQSNDTASSETSSATASASAATATTASATTTSATRDTGASPPQRKKQKSDKHKRRERREPAPPTAEPPALTESSLTQTQELSPPKKGGRLRRPTSPSSAPEAPADELTILLDDPSAAGNDNASAVTLTAPTVSSEETQPLPAVLPPPQTTDDEETQSQWLAKKRKRVAVDDE